MSSNSVYTGGCYCSQLRYKVTLSSPEEARTSLCHCDNCKKFTGGPFGVTTKVPIGSFEFTSDSHALKHHEADNGSGSLLHREFCGNCGGPILEYGEAAKDKWRYIFTGTFDKEGRAALPPKGEFFCEKRDSWVPEVPNVFHKAEIH